jgi:hypothetical protein
MKHIWKRSKEHAAGSLDVTENMSSFTSDCDLRAEFSFQLSDNGKKCIPVRWCLDLGNLKEDFSKPAGVGCPGRCAAPGQALPLHMNQTSLHYDVRPNLANNSHYGAVTVYGKAMWIQTSPFQTCKVLGKLWGRIFRNTVPSSYKLVSLGIHQDNKAMRPVQKCTIKNKVMVLHQVRNRFWRRLYQIAVNHTVKLPWAIAALVCQLPDRITLDNPKPKQFLLFGIDNLVMPAFATTSMSARSTEPTLFSPNIMTVSPKNA